MNDLLYNENESELYILHSVHLSDMILKISPSFMLFWMLIRSNHVLLVKAKFNC